jgi:predicted molibdopterin-dependent oxidoreductase YjgC
MLKIMKWYALRAIPSNPVSRGQVCVKGHFGTDFLKSPERLTTPLIRKNGELVESSWDEALDLVAEKLKGVKGTELAGFSSARATNEENYLFQKLLRSLGTNNIDHCARL